MILFDAVPRPLYQEDYQLIIIIISLVFLLYSLSANSAKLYSSFTIAHHYMDCELLRFRINPTHAINYIYTNIDDCVDFHVVMQHPNPDRLPSKPATHLFSALCILFVHCVMVWCFYGYGFAVHSWSCANKRTPICTRCVRGKYWNQCGYCSDIRNIYFANTSCRERLQTSANDQR